MNDCDPEVYANGQPLLAAATGPTGGAKLFEEWVQTIARESGQRVDWHYVGGRARVLVIGDLKKVREVAERTPLPEEQEIIQWAMIPE